MTQHPLPSTYLRPSSIGDGDAADAVSPLIGMMDDVANAMRGPALQLAIDMRIEAIVRYGHDAEHDAMQPIDELPRLARKHLTEAAERISGTGQVRQLPAARRSLARAAALCLAAIDRLDAAMAAETKQQELGL